VQRLIERVPYKIGARNFVSPSVQVQAKDGAVRQVDVVEIASVVVAELKKMAEDHLGRKVRHAVVTVPQHFGGSSTWAAMDAGKIAGLDVVRTVSEPVAAAVAYGLRGKLREDGNALVLHVGGARLMRASSRSWMVILKSLRIGMILFLGEMISIRGPWTTWSR